MGIRKLLQTNIPGTIIKFIANYIKRLKVYTAYRNYTSIQHHFKTAVPHGGVLSPTTCTPQTYHDPEPGSSHGLRRSHHHHIYTHKHEYSQEIHKTIPTSTCTLFTPDPAEYKSNLDLKIYNTALLMATHPKVLGLTLDPYLTYNTHISVHAHNPLQIIKSLNATGWVNKWDTYGCLQSNHETGSGVFLFHMVASCILAQQ